MGHKIHPSGLRLGITQEHRSKWFATSKTYPILLQEDYKIRTFIQKKYGAAGISDVLIARKADQLELELKTARPGVIVGRQGSGIEELRSGIQKTIGDRTRQVRINVVEVERVDADAFLLAFLLGLAPTGIVCSSLGRTSPLKTQTLIPRTP